MTKDKIIQIEQFNLNTEKEVILGLSDLGNIYKMTPKGWKFLIESPQRDESEKTN